MTIESKIATRQQLQATLKRGFKALSEGRIDEANACCRQILSKQPDLVQGHFLVGLTALEAKDRHTAFSAFSSVTRLDKKHAAAWANLAKLFMGEGQVSRADAALAQAVAQEPAQAIVCDLIGTVYSQMGEFDQAQHWFERACEAQPNHPPYMLNVANNYLYRGELDTAEQLFRRIIEIQNNSPQAHWSLAGARKAKDDRHIRQMQTLVAEGNLHARAAAFYFYAMGKEYEDLEQWEPAFAALSKGASARRGTVEYDEASEIEMFRYLEENFDAAWVADENVSEYLQAATPIFVLGQPRTGTTLIDRIISSHSEVHSAGELQQFSLAMRRLSQHRDPRRFSADFFAAARDLDFAKVGKLYLDTTRRMQGDKTYFIDKLPQNYLLIPFILKALPNAKIVHLTRGAMDACFASYKQLFADAYLHSYDQQEMARHHARYLHLMGIWRTHFDARIIDISYEQTAANFEPNVRKLITRLGLPWEDACLHFHQQTGAVSTASAAQVREPVHTRSIDRWQRYARELAPMTGQLNALNVPLSTT